MRHVRTRLAVIATAMLIGVALVGCSDDASTGGGAGGGENASTNGSTDSDSDADDKETPVALTGKACLDGSWLQDNESALSRFHEFGDEFTNVSGSVVVTFGSDGSLETEYKDLTMDATTNGITVKLVRNGFDTGTWSADESKLSINETDMTSKLTMTGKGMNMTVPSDPAIYPDASYTCEGDTATITTKDSGGPIKMNRQ